MAHAALPTARFLLRRSSRRGRFWGTLAATSLACFAPVIARASEQSERRERPAPLAGPLAPAALGVGGGLALSAHDTSPRAVPGRLVVKYKSSLDDCAHCLLASGQPFERTTGTDSLDLLNAKLGVRSARPLLFRRHGMRAAQARAGFRAHLEGVQRRFPVRAARGRPLDEIANLTGVYVLEISTSVDPVAAAREYAADPGVAWAEPDFEAQVSLLTDDPYLSTSGAWGQSYGDLWGLYAIGAPAAWDTSIGAGTVIAVVDTGVDPAHPDLAANLWTNPGEVAGNGVDDDGNGFVDDVVGWDFVDDDPDPLDRHGHGTHVAGTTAAVGDNTQGVAGVAWGARVMALKGLDDSGSGRTSDLAAAIVYAAENGADVINNSWGGFGLSVVVYEAIDAADALGTVVASAAGNDGRDIGIWLLWLPAGHPRGLTVGATMWDGTRASFSNTGEALSLVAPGVDVLSLRSTHEVFSPSLDVGQRYLRLSGTSMASPHAAGAAAALLGALPGLTTTETRWHLELAADQPGAPGYEGQLHNPSFGYGRLDAASMFAPPPITTRLTAPRVREWHAFAGTSPVVPGKPGRFLFTTLSPVAWSITTPPWLLVAPASGTGDSSLGLQIDTTGVAAGSYGGNVDLLAPLAVDGGASFAAQLHVHEDGRIGGRSTVGTEGFGGAISYSPAALSNGVSTLAAWKPRGGGAGYLEYAVVDGAGGVSGPIVVTDRPAVADLSIATDGHDFLLAWLDQSYQSEGLRFARVGADGDLRDTGTVEVLSRVDRPCTYYDLAGAGFDGESYWLGLIENRYCSDTVNFFVVQVRPDGSFGRKTRVERLRTNVFAEFECRAGSCLFAWLDGIPEGTDAYGKYIRGGWALPLSRTEPLSEPRKVLNDLWIFTDLATDGDNFLALGQRAHLCDSGDFCRAEVIATRIAADGQPLDLDGTVVSNIAPTERVFAWPSGVAWDGDSWLASYQLPAIFDSPFDNGSYVFTNRLDALGNPLSTEAVGDLVDDAGRASESVVATTATHAVVVWEDGRTDPLELEPYGHPAFSHHLAQRVLPREPGSAYPDRPIGSIGSLTVAEGGRVAFRAVAPGFDPTTSTFSASGLPPGAVFDPATRLFQWRPTGAQAGSHTGLEIQASDGAASTSETFDVTVQPAIPSISGQVELPDGTPLAHAVLDVRGTLDRHRTIVADEDGRYRIEGALVAGRRVTIRLATAMRRQYKTISRTVQLIATSGDVGAPDLVAIPK